MNDEQVFGVILVLLFTVIVPASLMVVIPVAKALAKRLGDRVDPPGSNQEDVEELKGRVHELEERLDFTERILAQVREPASLKLDQRTPV